MKRILPILLSILIVLAFVAIAYAATANNTGPPTEIKAAASVDFQKDLQVDPQMGNMATISQARGAPVATASAVLAPAEQTTRIYVFNESKGFSLIA